jgi:peptidoglycan-associated lipoprotein
MKDDKMKLTKFGSLFAIGLTLSLVAVGCKHQPQGVTPLPGARTGPPVEAGPGTAIGPGTGPGTGSVETGPVEIKANEPGSHSGWPEDAETLKSDTVYFAYDSSVVRSGEKHKVAAVADYLKGNPSVAVRVEGNCDERGTEEYNRALGERRALAVREMLVNLGIDPSRVDTISYGKDRPVEPLHTEAAWSKNRRDDFVLLTPSK